MVIIYIALRGSAYKQEIEQDLRISQKSVNIALKTLVEDGLVKAIKSEDERLKQYHEPTPSGKKVASLILEMLRVVQTSAAESEHKRARS